MTVGAAAGSLTFKYCIRQKLKNLVLSSIYDSDMDPHWMQCGSDPGSASILKGVDENKNRTRTTEGEHNSVRMTSKTELRRNSLVKELQKGGTSYL